MTVSRREQISHVVRRGSMGAHPDVVEGLATIDAAKARILDLSAPAPQVPRSAPPASYQDVKVGDVVSTIAWWLGQMASSPRLIEERLVWFWHDHFATSVAKARVPYLMEQQHVTVRAHATGSFADLLHAIAKDPAMLLYLDGISNAAGQVNENFGRECLELFTMGIGGGYKQSDVVEASRSFTGWVVNLAGRPFSERLTRAGAAPWTSIFIPQRHDAGEKTLLGTTGALDLDGALDVILSNPSTGRFVAKKLYRELVGLDPDDATTKRLGDAFARDYAVMGLAEAIIAEPAFTAPGGIRARVRTPVEKLIGILQAGGDPSLNPAAPRRRGRNRADSGVGRALRTIGYIPFVPPNVAGFPEGPLLLGPHQLVHTFDLLAALPAAPVIEGDADAVFARFGIFDVASSSRAVIDGERDPGRRFALAATSPEFAVT
jgi:uncharacterized protein (DUF1800 family)